MSAFITLSFVFMILCLAVWDGYTFWDREGKDHRNLKGEMTGLGILGTFVGICLGLWQFDTGSIKESIPPLLEGLKTAFITSIAGIGCSVAVAIAQSILPSRYAKSGDPATDRITELIRLLDETMQGVREGQVEMVGDMKGLRAEMGEALGKLAEGATREIIAALEAVIRDFNHNLQEQFGENFKQLNEACGKLLVWQQQHREQVEAATAALEAAKAAVETSVGALEQHTTRAEELIETLLAGRTSLEAMARLVQLIQETSEGLEATLARADRLLDTADNQAESLAARLAEAVASQKTLHERLGTTLVSVSGQLATVAKSADEISTKLKEGVKLSDGHIEKAHKNLQDALTSLTEHFGRSYQQYLEGLRRFTDPPEGRDR